MLFFDGKHEKEEALQFNKEGISLDLDRSYFIYDDCIDGLQRLLPSLKGKIELVYIDPPFNTNQTFAVSDGRASTISRKKTGKIAYEDTMTKEEFLSFMYKVFVLLHELLSEDGSLYVHIDTKMSHYFKVMLDDIFGDENFKNDITRIKSNPKNFDRKAFGNQKDVILFYSKDYKKNIWNDVRIAITDPDELKKKFPKIDKNGRRYTTIPLHAPGESSVNSPTGQPWRGMNPPEGRHWRTNPAEFDRMDNEGLIEWSSNGNPRIKKFADEHKGMKIQDAWTFKDPQYPIYPTEKNLDMISLIVQQSSNINGYVLDCFSGSGTTLLAAIQNGRKFIGIDKSEISLDIVQQKLSEHDFEIIKIIK